MTTLAERTEQFLEVAPDGETARRWAERTIAWPGTLIDTLVAYKKLDRAYDKVMALCVDAYRQKRHSLAGVERARNMTVQEWAEEVSRRTAPADLAEYLEGYLEVRNEERPIQREHAGYRPGLGNIKEREH